MENSSGGRPVGAGDPPGEGQGGLPGGWHRSGGDADLGHTRDCKMSVI